MARIAVDAMGGDFAPRAPVAGVLQSLLELPALHTYQLVGQSDVIEHELNSLLGGEFAAAAVHRDRISLVEATEVIAMSDKPSVALRGKTESSMVVGIRRVADGMADGFVSAGNTGAQMAASTYHLKLHPGLKRPAIGTVFPTAKRPVLVLDSGANVDCSPLELVQFARIGAVYAKALLGRAMPVVGLLSIGEEAEKGNAVVKEAHQLLAASGLNFIGNIEGRDIPAGCCDRGEFDVVICDGFTGNVLLKFYESVVPMMVGMIVSASSISAGTLRQALSQLDAEAYGGAPLLGVRGVSIISHGKSSPLALMNAVRVAIMAVESGMTEEIGRHIALDVPAANGEPGTAA